MEKRFDAKFHESNQNFDVKFSGNNRSFNLEYGEVIDLSEGEKQRAYQDGYEDNQENLDKILIGSATSIRTNATSICAYGLAYRNSLVDLYAPNVKSLGSRAISECNSLVKVDFPNLTSIGANALRYNEKLAVIILRSKTVCSLNSAVSIGGSAIVYVPDNLLNQYKTANKWKDIADRIKPLSELE